LFVYRKGKLCLDVATVKAGDSSTVEEAVVADIQTKIRRCIDNKIIPNSLTVVEATVVGTNNSNNSGEETNTALRMSTKKTETLTTTTTIIWRKLSALYTETQVNKVRTMMKMRR
jgi:microcompartment protein CcmL/EutN